MSSVSAPPWANASASSSLSGRPVVEENLHADPGTEAGSSGGGFLARPHSTLDEPVMDTVLRDARAVADKLRVVLLPLDRDTHFGYAGVAPAPPGGGAGMGMGMGGMAVVPPDTDEISPGANQKRVLEALRQWDLWGPLLICLALGVVLSFRAPVHQASAVFGAVFVAVWVGAAVVTVNAQLLGSTLSFFQSVCVLGYCVFPMFLSSILISVLQYTPLGVVWIDLVWISVGFVWSVRASSVFFGQVIDKGRRFLTVYPVFFFYTFLGWLILLF